MSNDDLPRSKAVMRGKTLVAWFAEATPPVLWRFLASDVTGGFGLRSVDGRTELIGHEGGAHPQVIATFTSEASAERALARLSRALLSYKATWKKVLKTLAAIVILILIIMAYMLYQKSQTLSALSNLQGLGAGYMPKAASSPLMLPGMAPQGSAAAAPAPSGPPMGSPVDVDKFYK